MKYKLLTFFFCNLFCFSVNAVDATNYSKIIFENGSWKIIEMTLPHGILYRIATDSINIDDTHLTFDLISKCSFDSANMIKKFKNYDPNISDGKLILQYKISNRFERQEIVETEMSKGDVYGFFKFKKLLAGNLFESKETSRLAIWIPQSGDRKVQRSTNFYFSLDGFKVIYTKAKALCNDNK